MVYTLASQFVHKLLHTFLLFSLVSLTANQIYIALLSHWSTLGPITVSEDERYNKKYTINCTKLAATSPPPKLFYVHVLIIIIIMRFIIIFGSIWLRTFNLNSTCKQKSCRKYQKYIIKSCFCFDPFYLKKDYSLYDGH